ncbi:hypothetical protein JTE90_016186 [Oedothorax gibbosus]|uniref:Cystatin domain-containing protein n=1 Tax=Oedothorax gibbosus TaxID=931172 RepID=A0AAV6U7A6_9ARAC|nr:hypothetical protein JTE90_016186 [Oedothorax gibbosus]
MTGGWSDVKDLNSESIQNVAKNATRALAIAENSEYHLKMLNLTKARKQVVSGMNYKLELQISPTECKVNENLSDEELDNCPLQKCDKPNTCTATAWVRVWLNETERFKLTDYSCGSKSFC